MIMPCKVKVFKKNNSQRYDLKIINKFVFFYSKEGEQLPSVELYENNPGEKVNIADLFKGKKGIIFAVPGAFTPGCSKVII